MILVETEQEPDGSAQFSPISGWKHKWRLCLPNCMGDLEHH